MGGYALLRQGQRVRFEGVVDNIRDISDPAAGPFASVGDVPNVLDASFIIKTDKKGRCGSGKAFLQRVIGDLVKDIPTVEPDPDFSMWVGDGDHEGLDIILRKGDRR